MRETVAPEQHGYAEPMERMYRWLRRHPWLVDGALAVALVAGSSANAFAGELNVLPATLALAGAVAVRRRFPVAAAAVALAIGAAQVILGIGPLGTHGALHPTFADCGLLVLVYTVATARPRRVSVPVAAGFAALFAAAVARWEPGAALADGMTEFVVTGLFVALVPVSAWVLGNSIAYRRAYLAAMEDRAVRAEAERDARAGIAAAAERARIARELHDVIAHNLSVMVAQADGGRYVFDVEPEKSRQVLAEISGTGRQALSEMSHLLGVLRTSEDDSGPGPAPPGRASSPAWSLGAGRETRALALPTAAAPLAPAPGIGEIPRLIAQARETGTRVTWVVEGTTRPVPDGLSLAVYRIVQEALTNVRKHAGPGASAVVTLGYGKDGLSVSVVDDGGAAGCARPGSAPHRGDLPYPGGALRSGAVGGHGLAGMRERAALYGGRVTAGHRCGTGFEVTAWLPLPDDASRDAA